jgi:hypothetical protein
LLDTKRLHLTSPPNLLRPGKTTVEVEVVGTTSEATRLFWIKQHGRTLKAQAEEITADQA